MNVHMLEYATNVREISSDSQNPGKSLKDYANRQNDLSAVVCGIFRNMIVNEEHKENYGLL